jgi:site-specific DNA recombinase
MKALIYTRVSTQKQVNEGVSLDNQLDRTKAFCFAKGWEIIGIITDPAETGKNLERDGVREIIRRAQKKEFDILVLYKLDRISRSVEDLTYLRAKILEKNNILFASLSENIDTSTASGRFMFNIHCCVAEYERDSLSEKTSDAQQYKKAKGEVYGNIPMGLMRDGNSLVPNEQELDMVKIAKRLKEEGLSLQKISTKLFENGLVSRGGNRFSSSGIRRLLAVNC